MKLTSSTLRRIIAEEIEAVKEASSDLDKAAMFDEEYFDKALPTQEDEDEVTDLLYAAGVRDSVTRSRWARENSTLSSKSRMRFQRTQLGRS